MDHGISNTFFIQNSKVIFCLQRLKLNPQEKPIRNKLTIPPGEVVSNPIMNIRV